ncbi:hypothetical protein CLCR_03731 [Cladophialophora carrionii]|uniref:Uncharacterized protein n=1 Tax=Cladophialophora carrionii TaxID=86049 RepID=A0A1C1CGN0_9EURO|nr:hypothetical protein CLCR_03731 [Cladophialophora carrionii]
MCWFKLDTCPYPHHEPIRALIFIPGNASRWKHCDKPQPWGRLSCGKLIVQHNAAQLRDSHPALAADCEWCTAVLKLAATKSKEIQQQARTDIAEMEEKFNTDAKLKELHTKIQALETEVIGMRNQAWELRLAADANGGGGEWEEIQSEHEIGQGGHAGAP